MVSENCPICGERKNQLNACPRCGFTRKAEEGSRSIQKRQPSTRNIRDAKGTKKKAIRKHHKKKSVKLSAEQIMRAERIRSGIIVKKSPEKLTEDQATNRKRVQRRGFHEGAAVPGSNVRKIDK